MNKAEAKRYVEENITIMSMIISSSHYYIYYVISSSSSTQLQVFFILSAECLSKTRERESAANLI